MLHPLSRRLFVVVLLLASPALWAAAPAEKVEVWGDVVRVTEHGLIVDAALEENGERWRGLIFLIAHPKQKTIAENDRIKGATCERIGNFRDGGNVIRAYKYLSTRFPD